MICSNKKELYKKMTTCICNRGYPHVMYHIFLMGDEEGKGSNKSDTAYLCINMRPVNLKVYGSLAEVWVIINQ